MNGEQQRERHTAVARIDKSILALEEAWRVEVDCRLKGEDRLQEIIATMLDSETQFRKNAIADAKTYILSVELMTNQFIMLSWWKRWGWIIFGPMFLLWTSSKELRQAFYAQKKAKATRAGTPSPETLRKQQSYTERPQ